MYVLLVLVVGGGFSAEFSNKDACDAAREVVASVSTPNSFFAVCLPKD